MSKSNHSSSSRGHASVFELNGVPSFGQALPLALQHVVAAIVGCVTPAIIVAGVAGVSDRDRVILIQAALIASAISTLLQLFPFVRTRKFQLGASLPVIMGISFAYVPSMQAIAESFDIATILGAQIVGGCVALLVGIFIRKIRVLFPPLVTGTVVFTIGLSLVPYRDQLYGRRNLQSEIRFLEKLAGRSVYPGRSGRTEPFCQRLSETCLDSDRHPCRICVRRLSRTGGSVRRFPLPASFRRRCRSTSA